MTLVELLQAVSRLGTQLTVDGDGVRYKAPVGTMTSALRGALQRHKAELMQLLIAPPADAMSDEPCPICGSRERWHWLDGRRLCRVCMVLDFTPLTLAREG
jgi:hypothetical protein